MKTLGTYCRYVVLFCLAFFTVVKTYGQVNYAGSQATGASGLACVNCIVNNAANAADGNLQSFSTLNVVVGVAAQTYQELIFPGAAKVAAGTPVTIKLGTGNNLLDVTALGGIIIQAYNGNTPLGSGVSAATLATAASNNNQIQVSFTPNQIYDRVRVTLDGGLAGALSSIYVYEAFYRGPASLACNSPFDELHGISSAILNLGVDVGGVANPQLAIDGNLNTASTLNAGVGALGAYAQQTIIYQSASTVGDSIRLTLSIPQTLIDAGVLTSISVLTYNGNNSNNDALFLNSALLSVRLLDLNANRRKVTVTYAPTKIFDRVQLRLGNSIANVLSSLDLYEAQKLIPKPVIKFNTVVTNNANICSGSTATLSATITPNTTFNWYTQATGGSPVFTGANFTTPVLSAITTYYVSAARTGCTDESERTAVTVTVNTIPAAPVVTNATVAVCPGMQATFTAQAVAGVTVNWYTAATGGTPVFSGNTFTTPAISANTTYYAEAVAGGTCVSPTRTAVNATISALPATPVISPINSTICAGSVAVLSIASPVAGQTYNWYSTATGGTVLYTGINFTTPALTANTNYYAEAVNATGCASSTRVQTAVTVIPKPADPTLTANSLTISAGQTATITVSNAQTGVTYNWYTSATASTPIFTGNPYTTPALYTSATYYVNAVNATGCVSTNRTAVTINVNSANSAICSIATTQSTNVNGICVLCGVTNNTLAADADTTTASTITVGAGLLGGYAEQQLIFGAQGFAGDSIRLGLRTPVSLADVGLLGQIQVILYNGATQVASYTLDNASIKLRLLSGGGNRYNVIVPATGNYDRIAIRLNSGAATLLTSLQVYYAIQQYPKPVVAGNTEICKGSPATLNITSPGNGTFNWYATPTGGAPVLSGTNVTTPALITNTTYYIEYSRGGTCASSVRYPVTILVNDAPIKPIINPSNAVINSGQTASFTATVPANVTVKWYSGATGGTALATGNTFTTPALSANGDYYAETSIGSCTSPDRTHVTVTVNPVTVPTVAVAPPTQSVGLGAPATLTASSNTPGAVFNWYTTPTGGTSIFTGPVFSTPPVTGNTTYYAEAVIPATGTKSTTRAPGAITINPNALSPVGCDPAIDQTTASSGVLCVGCTVLNPTASVDNDRNTASQLNVLAGVVNAYEQQTLRFAGVGHAGDSVIVELGTPGSLASVGVLSSISLATYNGATFNNDRFNVNGSLLTISLLNGTSRFRIAFKATADFDRVEIRLNSSLAGVLTSLNIYDATQEVAAPVVNAATVATCQGSQATLTATAPNYVTVKWYNTPTGGAPLFTGNTFNTPALTASTIYYAEASRTADGCTQATRTPVNVTVTAMPAAPVVNASTVTVCSGQPATFIAQAVSGVTFNWYTTANGGTPVFTGNPYTTPALTANTTYYVEASSGTQCGSSTRTQVNANVTASPLTPTVNNNPTQTCSGSSALLTASSTQPGVTFNWYTTATGGTPVFTGQAFNTPALTANTSYYVEAANGTCTSLTRAQANVVVNPAPVAPTVTVNPATAQVASGQTATLTASSATAGTAFNWYTAANGGTPVFTGNPFTTPALTTNTTYYAESVLTATGCTSPTRTAVNVFVSQLTNTSCDLATTQTTDVNGGVLCLGCTVITPANATDADTTTASQIILPVTVGGGYVAQTLIFGTSGILGDSVSVRISIPASLLSAGVLDRLQIASYNGATYNNDRVNLSSNLLSVRILTGNQTAIVKFKPSAVFDRVEVRLTGDVASILGSLNIYYASKQVELPQVAIKTINVCSGNGATFTVTNARAGITYKWYDAPSGGTLLGTGDTFNTGNLTATKTYYVESSHTASGCANPNRVAVTANVTPSPVTPALAQNTFTVCAGTSVTFTVTNPTNQTIRWYDAPTNGNLLFTGTSFTVAPVTDANYYAEASNGQCSSSVRTVATVHINNTPQMASVQANNLQVCAGSAATIQIASPESGVTYNYYLAASGGSAVGNGIIYTTGAINSNTSYYIEATNNGTGCINLGGRTRVDISISGQASAPVLSASATAVCSGGSTSISVVNPVAGLIYNWYTAATGGAPIFTGTTYTLNNVTTNATYFVESSNGSGCTSAARTQTDITVVPVPTAPTVLATGGGSGQSTCSGSSATLTVSNPVANNVYRWFDAATGGNLLYTGTQYVTPPLTASATYYVEAATAGNCNASARTAVTVTINAIPGTPVLAANNVSVCEGTSATLTISSPQTGITYNWYDSPAMTNLLFSGTPYITGPITGTTNFYVAAVNASGCSNGNLAMAQVTTQAAPAAPTVSNGTAVAACSGTQATLTIGNIQSGYTYNWYSATSGGSSLYTGTSFTTPILSANATYYAEASNSNGCSSVTRTAVNITVNPIPGAPVVSAAGTSICPGVTTTLTATAAAGATIKWFASATGGTALATGASYTTPALSVNTTYYAEAGNATGCNATTRTPVTVQILGPLAAPIVSVASHTANTIVFSWTAVTGATGYEISFNNGVSFSAPTSGSSGLSTTVINLQPAQSISIIVRATGGSACQLSTNSTAVTGIADNPMGNQVFVPNAFTPNGDGNNDILYIYGTTIKSMNFSVYDQWGEVIFKSNSQSAGWDGTYKGNREPVGVYVYYVDAVMADGSKVNKKGTITLIR